MATARETGKNVNKSQKLLLVLFLIFIIAGFIELTYGSAYLGAAFFALSVLMLIKLSTDRRIARKQNNRRILLLLGATLLFADLLYNYYTQSTLQTLDSMVLLLGVSLILASVRNEQVRDIGLFSAYLSSFFIAFFMIIYVVPTRLGIGLPLYYGHYAVLLPVFYVLRLFGLELSLVPDTLGLIDVHGTEFMTLKMDLACFGWYSMFLIISTLLAYSIVLHRFTRRDFIKFLLILTGASYAANFLRVTVLVALGFYYGFDTMMLAHSHLGWVLFAVILLPVLYYLLLSEDYPSADSTNVSGRE
ncbi:MAG TPA: archaeosortase C [Methanomicrobia archaeon]|nr:archaeosortase C [Methanomicrobia archaeon]